MKTLSTSTIGLLVGLLLAIAAAAGGFVGFLVAVVLGGVGWLVGAQIEGKVDLPEMARGRRG